MFTDLEDSTRLWEVDPTAMRADVARHGELIAAAVEANGGVRSLEQGAGDSTVAAFRRASDALAAALAVQEAMHAEVWASATPLRVRVAVHAGEVGLEADGAYSGPTMNRCGRLLQAAHGGQILASATAIELGRPALPTGASITDLGRHHLRGIDDPIAIVQLGGPTLPSTFPPPRTQRGGATALPTTDSTFIGRSTDIELLVGLLGSHRVVTVVGAGGCGKTRLALEVARQCLDHHPDGVRWVDLAPVTSAESVVDAAATAVGLRGTAAPSRARVVEHLAGRSMLVVVDNCEHVIDEAAALVAAVEARCPDVRVLATSREPLALRDEVVWRVPSLAVPIREDGRDLHDTDAGRLLLDRIRRVHPGHEPTDGDLADLATICRRLDGIPLALELAAARTATIPPAVLAQRLAERFSLLDGGGRNVRARQRTLEASVAWSYQLLDEDEQRALRTLSVFTSSFPTSAAIEVIGGDERRAEELVLRLLDCSLLADRTGRDHPPRVQMLEAVRWFARERLVALGEAETALDRHLGWCVEQARSLGRQLEGPAVRQAVTALEQDVDNLRAAMQRAIDHDRGADATRIITSTFWFWIWRGRIPEARRWLHRADASGADMQPDELVVVQWARAELTAHGGTRQAPFDRIALDALARARDLGDEHTEGRLLMSHSRILAFSDPEAAMAEAEQGRRLCERHGDRFWAATALVSQSLAQTTLGRFDVAESFLDELRVLAAQLDHPQLVADEIARRVLVDRRAGRYDSVRGAVAAIDEVTEDLTDLSSRALVYAAAAFVDVVQGRASAALASVEDLADRYRAAGEHQYLPSFALPAMEALIALGRPTEALDRFGALWSTASTNLHWRIRMGQARAVAQLVSGDPAAARTSLLDVLETAHAYRNRHDAAIADRILAAIERADGEYGAAEARLHDALEVHVGFAHPQLAADVLEELAGLELDHRRPGPAAVLFGAAATIRSDGAVAHRVGRQDAYEADLATLRTRLDEDDLARAWHQGAALTLAEAAELARRGRGRRGRPTTGWESLTATEAKVAELAAQGRTNPEIAEALIMGRATVKTHISTILRKLGLDNRTQLAGLVARRDRAPAGGEPMG